MPKTGIHWFRHGLRLHDNPALLACADECERFVPIFIFDGFSAGLSMCGYNRFRFLLQSLKDLEAQFAAHGIHLMCFYGEPHAILEQLFKDWDVKVLSFEKDSEVVWRKRDNSVKQVCKQHNVQLVERVSHTLYDPEDIFNMNDDMPPNTCEELRQFCFRMGEPERPALKPDLQFIASNLMSTASLYDAERHRVPDMDKFPEKKPECPEQLEHNLFLGGEMRALELFKHRLANEIESFKQGKLNPNLSKPVLFTKEVSLSPYLRYGCLSVRKFYWDIKKAYLKVSPFTQSKQQIFTIKDKIILPKKDIVLKVVLFGKAK